MYVEDFESFLLQAKDLYKQRPLDTRYCLKYRHCDGVLVLKVTDDRTCLKFKTDQQSDLKKLERLNNLFFTLMASGEEPSEDLAAVEHQGQQGTAAASSKKNRKKG